MKKIFLSILQCKVGLHNLSGCLKIFQNTKYLHYLPSILWEQNKQTKQNYIKYVPNQQVKILQTVSPHLALQHVRVFPDMYSYSILPRKCPRTSLSLTNT